MLATKLFVPRPPPGLVSRPRLVSRLHGGLSRQLTLVCAPAGFGKTALLADWCSHLRQPVIWLSLDAGDNDPVRFWRHVTAALDRLRPGLAERVAPLLGSPESASFDGLITALVNELAAELFVTLNTVKKHVTHILDKLGATNRTEATVRAREFGLLS